MVKRSMQEELNVLADELSKTDDGWISQEPIMGYDIIENQHYYAAIWNTYATKNVFDKYVSWCRPWEHHSTSKDIGYYYSFFRQLAWQCIYFDYKHVTTPISDYCSLTKFILKDKHIMMSDFVSLFLYLMLEWGGISESVYNMALLSIGKYTHAAASVSKSDVIAPFVVLDIKIDHDKIPDLFYKKDLLPNSYKIWVNTHHAHHTSAGYDNIIDQHTCLFSMLMYTITHGNEDMCILCGSKTGLSEILPKRYGEIATQKQDMVYQQKRATMRSQVTPKVRMAVVNRDGMICQTCGIDVKPGNIHIAHIISVKDCLKYGIDEKDSSSVDNLFVSCADCNQAQKGKSMSYKWYKTWKQSTNATGRQIDHLFQKIHDPSRTPEHA